MGKDEKQKRFGIKGKAGVAGGAGLTLRRGSSRVAGMDRLDQEKFRRIVAHARLHNPFYARWITDPERVPVLPRQVFQENNDAILNGRAAHTSTSGSVNKPIRVNFSPQRVRMERADEALQWKWIGGVIPAVTIWVYADGVVPPGSIDLYRPIPEQVAALERLHGEMGFAAIHTFNSHAVNMAEWLLERGRTLPWVRRLLMISEPVEPWQEERLRLAFPGAQVCANYSSKEAGLIAVRCPHDPRFYHVMSHKIGLEILDREGRPCRDGELGMVYLTDYTNTYTPFIRHQIEDLAAWGDCPCGKIDRPALSRLYGKIRMAFLLPDGSRKPANILAIQLRKFPELRQHQIVQETLERYVFRCVMEGQRREEDLRRLLVEFLGYVPREIVFEYLEEIPRAPGGKFFLTLSRV